MGAAPYYAVSQMLLPLTNTSLANFDRLAVPMAPTDNLVIEWFVAATWSSNVGLTVAVTVPGAATVTVSVVADQLRSAADGLTTGGTTTTSGVGISVLNLSGTSNTGGAIRVVASVKGDGVTAGNVNLQFATPSAGTYTVSTGYVRAIPALVATGLVGAIKSSDQSVNSGNTGTSLVTETDLSVSVGASDKWVIEWTVRAAYAANLGIKFAITVPTGATLDWESKGVQVLASADCVGNAQESTAAATGVTVLDITGTTQTNGIVKIVAEVTCDGTHAGTVALQFAQGTSSATNTTVQAGSSVVAVLQ